MTPLDRLAQALFGRYFEISYRLLLPSPEGRRFLRGAAVRARVFVHGYATTDDLDRLVESLQPGQGRPLLDLGCGLGGVAVHLAAATGAQVTGIDLSRRAVAAANARARASGAAASFRVGSMREPPSVGAVGAYALDSVMFTTIDADLIDGLRDVLLPNGAFFATTLALGSAPIDPVAEAGMALGVPVVASEDVTDVLEALSRRRRALAVAILRGAEPGVNRPTIRGRLAMVLVIAEESGVLALTSRGRLRRWRTSLDLRAGPVVGGQPGRDRDPACVGGHQEGQFIE